MTSRTQQHIAAAVLQQQFLLSPRRLRLNSITLIPLQISLGFLILPSHDHASSFSEKIAKLYRLFWYMGIVGLTWVLRRNEAPHLNNKRVTKVILFSSFFKQLLLVQAAPHMLRAIFVSHRKTIEMTL
jgi:hypothetical protein